MIFFYMIAAKIAMNDYGINGLDLCLFRTFVSFAMSGLIALICGVSFRVEKKFHTGLLIRSAVGTLGFTSMVFAVKYLPLGVHTILFNTAPF